MNQWEVAAKNSITVTARALSISTWYSYWAIVIQLYRRSSNRTTILGQREYIISFLFMGYLSNY